MNNRKRAILMMVTHHEREAELSRIYMEGFKDEPVMHRDFHRLMNEHYDAASYWRSRA